MTECPRGPYTALPSSHVYSIRRTAKTAKLDGHPLLVPRRKEKARGPLLFVVAPHDGGNVARVAGCCSMHEGNDEIAEL